MQGLSSITKRHKKEAAVLWTGGKDCSLALHWALTRGYKIQSLITFAPKNPKFLAHPVDFIKYQIKAMELPHRFLTIEGGEKNAYKESYVKAIRVLHAFDKIDTLITGDIAEVGGQPNWIRECSRTTGMDIQTPLWGIKREELMESLLTHKFEITFSCVKQPWLTEEWLGQKLDWEKLDVLKEISSKTGMDLCGEEGEYHTLVTDGPMFKKRVNIVSSSKQSKDSMMYLKIQEMNLQEK